MPSKTPIVATSIEALTGTGYPEPFKHVVAGRSKRRLGDVFGLQNFGVNLTELPPGACSALKHYHRTQDEFVYVLSGTLTLHYGEQSYLLQAGDCIGFAAVAENVAKGQGHQLCNFSGEPATYLEVGDRSAGDEVTYPDVDLKALLQHDGRWLFCHKDGRPYQDGT